MQNIYHPRQTDKYSGSSTTRFQNKHKIVDDIWMVQNHQQGLYTRRFIPIVWEGPSVQSKAVNTRCYVVQHPNCRVYYFAIHHKMLISYFLIPAHTSFTQRNVTPMPLNPVNVIILLHIKQFSRFFTDKRNIVSFLCGWLKSTKVISSEILNLLCLCGFFYMERKKWEIRRHAKQTEQFLNTSITKLYSSITHKSDFDVKIK